VFVVTVDQRRSRRGAIDAERFAARLNEAAAQGAARQFEVTVGDELQGVVQTPEALVEAVRAIAADGHWWTGVGVGEVQLEASARRSSGPAFVRARKAVERAKRLPWRLAVEGSGEEARKLESAFGLWLTVLDERTPKGWETVELRRAGRSEQEIAAQLGITQQAVNQRLRAAHFLAEESGTALLHSLAAKSIEAE
jgi:hypothetical protein